MNIFTIAVSSNKNLHMLIVEVVEIRAIRFTPGSFPFLQNTCTSDEI